MRNVTWPDNTCGVGQTSIHGCFTPDDMEWLLSMVSEGSFTPTFYEPRLPGFNLSRYGDRAAHQRAVIQKLRELFGETQEKMFYFNFKRSIGQPLLVALRLKGFAMICGEATK